LLKKKKEIKATSISCMGFSCYVKSPVAHNIMGFKMELSLL
jgi:hypothetical protein